MIVCLPDRGCPGHGANELPVGSLSTRGARLGRSLRIVCTPRVWTRFTQRKVIVIRRRTAAMHSRAVNSPRRGRLPGPAAALASRHAGRGRGDAFGSSPEYTVGVEEEFMVLDAETLALVPRGVKSTLESVVPRISATPSLRCARPGPAVTVAESRAAGSDGGSACQSEPLRRRALELEPGPTRTHLLTRRTSGYRTRVGTRSVRLSPYG